MKNIFSLVVALLLTLSGAVASGQDAEKKAESGFSEWLKGLQKKIGHIVPRKTVPVTTSVAGVRGAKENEQVKLYWKGKKGDEIVTEEEMTEFKAAIEIAAQGDKAAAMHELEKFMLNFPDSALIPDAKKTLDLVKAEPAEEKKQEEQKEEVKAESSSQ